MALGQKVASVFKCQKATVARADGMKRMTQEV